MAWILVLLPLAASMAAASSSLAKPGCPTRCGDIDILYPFGIGPGCFRRGFEITCNNMTDSGEKPFLTDFKMRSKPILVLNLTVTPRARVRVMVPVAYQCFDVAGNKTASFNGQLRVNPAGVYRISNTANELFVLGCDAFIYAGRGSRRRQNPESYSYFSGCVAYCNSTQSARDRKCNGVGCCHVGIPQALLDTRMTFGDWPHAGVDFSPCNHAFIVERKHYVFQVDDLKRTPDPTKPWSMPLWLDWAIRNGNNSLSCPLATESPGYACVSMHSDCANSTNGMGYFCKCKEGYEGNPYLDNGCTDIDECKQPHLHSCFGKCTNMDGSFDCRCPRGFQGNATQPNGCVKSIHIGLIIGLSVSSGPTILLLFIGSKIIIRKLKHQKEQKLRQSFGLMLLELVMGRVASEAGGDGNLSIWAHNFITDLMAEQLEKFKSVVC
ncbi:hypothetical protein ZWY2020_047491 [Hordeum vulgare]|nr:hypothetical protein ZWY2020_047491 [Hordeum vulgare]